MKRIQEGTRTTDLYNVEYPEDCNEKQRFEHIVGFLVWHQEEYSVNYQGKELIDAIEESYQFEFGNLPDQEELQKIKSTIESIYTFEEFVKYEIGQEIKNLSDVDYLLAKDEYIF